MAETLLLVIGGFIAALVSGTGGFGFAVVATAIWSPLVDPQRVTTLALVLQFVLNVVYLPYFWRDISLRRLAPLALGALLGVPLGAWVLSVLPAPPLRLGVGLLLLAWSVWMAWRAAWPQLQLAPQLARRADVAIGVAGGFLGGIAGLTGVIPALWFAMRGGDVRSNRGVVQGFILFTSALSFAWVARKVGVDAGTLTALWWSLPFVCVGGLLGLKVFSKLDTRRFNQVVLWLVGVCGLLISVQALRSW
jgi:uncharacterized protein